MYTIINTFDKLKEWCMTHGGVIALDTETTSLDYLDLKLQGISLSDGTDSCYILWDDTYTDYLNVYLLELDLLILHNAPFDMKVLYKYDISHTDKLFCTMTAAHILDERRTKKLKELAVLVLKVPEDQIQSYEEASKNGLDTQEFYEYAIRDALWTYQLYTKFKPKIRAQELSYLFYDIEMPFQYALRDLEINGVMIDADRVQSLLNQVVPKHRTLYKQMYDLAKIPYSIQAQLFEPEQLICGINLNNKQRCADVIQGLGFEITERTAGGQPSADKYTLARLKGQHPFIDCLAEYRVLDTLYNNFLKKAHSRIDADGRTRASVNNCVARTGRLSYSNPNFQNMPRPGTCPVEFRTVVVAPDGKVLVAADYSGQELRVLAHVSQDQGMINAFLNNQDLHLATANRFYNLGIPDECLVTSHPDYEKYKSKYKKERNNAKIINFGIAYGKGPVGFASDFNIPVDEATTIVDSYFKATPGVYRAIEGCHKKLYRCHYAATITGRRRRFDVINNRAKRQAFNHVIQGSGADMVKLAMGQLSPMFLDYPDWDAKLVLTVHDEIVAEVNESYAEQCKDLMINVMENVMKLRVPLVVEADIGRSYAEAK
jgi:DNA polymerase-1